MFSEGAERNKALGIWGSIGATAATGLLARGLLTRYAGWQYRRPGPHPGGQPSQSDRRSVTSPHPKMIFSTGKIGGITSWGW
jgi:hypothetical protein